MSVQNSNSSNQSTGGGWLLPALILISIGLALLVGAAGGAMLDEPSAQTQPTIYPHLPAPAPETLNYVPSTQTFAEPAPPAPAFDPCADPTSPVAGWEHGVGGQLPPCWSSWTREQQNDFLRSH